MENKIGYGLVLLSQGIYKIDELDELYQRFKKGGRDLEEMDSSIDESYRLALTENIKDFNQIVGGNLFEIDEFEGFDPLSLNEAIGFDREVIRRESALQIINQKEIFKKILKKITKNRIFELIEKAEGEFDRFASHYFLSTEVSAFFQINIDENAESIKIEDAFIGTSVENRDSFLSQTYEHLIGDEL